MATTDEYNPDDFERPSVTVDVAILTVVEDRVGLLLHRRPKKPFAGSWALPGGFVQMDESLQEAAERVLRDKGGLTQVHLEQLATFGNPDRDPRTRVISVAYMALADLEQFRGSIPADTDVATGLVNEVDGRWQVEVDGEAVNLAFDHDQIVATAVKRLRGKIDWTPVGFQLLPEVFTLRELQHVHEVVGGRAVNTQSFRRRMLASGELEDTGELEQDVSHRPGSLYRFVEQEGQS